MSKLNFTYYEIHTYTKVAHIQDKIMMEYLKHLLQAKLCMSINKMMVLSPVK